MVITQHGSFLYKHTIKLNELHIITGNQFAGAFNYSDCIILTPDLKRHFHKQNNVSIKHLNSTQKVYIIFLKQCTHIFNILFHVLCPWG